MTWRGSCVTSPAVIAQTLTAQASLLERVGLESGPLTPWLVNELRALELPVVCLDARHARAALSVQINKSDANDADGLAQIAHGMVPGSRGEEHRESSRARNAGLRKQLVGMRTEMTNQIRGLMKIFGLILPKGSGARFEAGVRARLAEKAELGVVVEPLLTAWRALDDQVATLERQLVRRLHDFIAELVKWESSDNERVLNKARWYIARSLAWGRGDEPPPEKNPEAVRRYLLEHAPPVYDPFCGGGSIPLETQRLGLRAYGSDLNPVAVMISKALVEFPPKFAGLPPVNPEARKKLASGGVWNAKSAQGLAEDVRYYGKWMREEAYKRIWHLYPEVELPDGSEATVIAWLWARTVASPNPAARGAQVPLVPSFMLSTKEGKRAWVDPVLDPAARDGYRF